MQTHDHSQVNMNESTSPASNNVSGKVPFDYKNIIIENKATETPEWWKTVEWNPLEWKPPVLKKHTGELFIAVNNPIDKSLLGTNSMAEESGGIQLSLIHPDTLPTTTIISTDIHEMLANTINESGRQFIAQRPKYIPDESIDLLCGSEKFSAELLDDATNET